MDADERKDAVHKVFSTRDDVGLLNRIRQELEARDIPCASRNETRTGAAAGEIPPLHLCPELYILDKSRLDEALAVVKELTAPSLHAVESWTCHSCGEVLEGQFEVCWNCGAERRPDRTE